MLLNTRFESMPHVMVVDDDNRIRALLSRYLAGQGFVVLEAADAPEAEALLESFVVDILVVDVMMPRKSGLDFIRDLRAHSVVPVVLLTARGEAQDRIGGLEAGADDYLPKPFEPRELLLRLQSILKRSVSKMERTPRYRMGPWVFDPSEDALMQEEGPEYLKLTAMEGALLRALTQSCGAVVTRMDLAKRCQMDDAGERTIDVQVTRLRRKIEADTKNPRYLQTLRGKGYILRAEEI